MCLWYMVETSRYRTRCLERVLEPEQTPILGFRSLAALSHAIISLVSTKVQDAIIAAMDSGEDVHHAGRSLGLDLRQMVIRWRESLKSNQ